MKRRRFSPIEEDIIRKSVERNIKPKDIAACLSASGHPRSVDTITRKIWSMNLLYPDKIKIKLEKKIKHTKAQNTYHIKQVTNEERRRLLSYHPNHTEEWQNALILSKTKCVDFKGTKIYTINGKPVTILEILKFVQD